MRCFGGLKVAAAIIFIVALPFNAMSQTAQECYEKGLAIIQELDRAEYNYRESKEGKAAYEKANNLLIKACELDTELCKKVRERRYQLSERVSKIYGKKCSSGEGRACYLDQNYSKGCELGNAASCYELGEQTAYKDGKRKALPYYEKACELKNSYSCILAGNIHGEGSVALDIPANADKFISFYQKACELNQSRCVSLAYAYLNGGVEDDKVKVRIPKDANKAVQVAELFEKYVRQKGTQDDYSNLYGLFVQLDGQKQATSAFQSMCDKREPKACAVLADVYARELFSVSWDIAKFADEGKVWEQAKAESQAKSIAKKVKELYRKACEVDKSYCEPLQ